MAADEAPPLTIPLAHWAHRQLRLLARETGSASIAAVDGATLLGERAAINGFAVPQRRSAGGKCYMLAARGGWLTLNLARDDDRDLLPALFGAALQDPADIGEIAELAFACDASALVARGREMGLALAHSTEAPIPPAVTVLADAPSAPPPGRPPLTIDLSALWAGPLCSHLLHMAGAQVIKVESTTRPDAMRLGDPAFFALLNGGKDSVALNLATSEGRRQLAALLERADVVIEASRPRALRHMGIDADAWASGHPGKVWITITGHGAQEAAADWVGFGDDCGVAGGLSAALVKAGGSPGFVGDAIADPLTGVLAARAAWDAWSSGCGGRIALAMSGVVAQALGDEQARNGALIAQDLKCWSEAAGRPFPKVRARRPTGPLAALGADTQRWLPC